MKHDGRAAGNDCDSSSFLMSPTLGSGKITWSPCSRNYLNAFLKYGLVGASCSQNLNFFSITALDKPNAC